MSTILWRVRCLSPSPKKKFVKKEGLKLKSQFSFSTKDHFLEVQPPHFLSTNLYIIQKEWTTIFQNGGFSAEIPQRLHKLEGGQKPGVLKQPPSHIFSPIQPHFSECLRYMWHSLSGIEFPNLLWENCMITTAWCWPFWDWKTTRKTCYATALWTSITMLDSPGQSMPDMLKPWKKSKDALFSSPNWHAEK